MKRLTKKMLFLVSLFLYVINAFATDIYVSASGSDANDGLTILSPKQTLQAALDAIIVDNASNDATGDAIIIDGTIQPADYLYLGGLKSQNLTIRGNTSAATDMIDGSLKATPNTAMFDVYVTSITFENLTIKNCSSTSASGGAVQVRNTGTAIFNSCIFKGNNSLQGGAIRSNFGSLNAHPVQIDRCLFDGNDANISGGAIHLNDYGGAIISNSTFVNNHAVIQGGAIFSRECNDVFTNITVFDNYVDASDPNHAGGIYAIAGSTITSGPAVNNLEIRNSIIYHNEYNGSNSGTYHDLKVVDADVSDDGGSTTTNYKTAFTALNTLVGVSSLSGTSSSTTTGSDLAVDLSSSGMVYNTSLGVVTFNNTGTPTPVGFGLAISPTTDYDQLGTVRTASSSIDAGAWVYNPFHDLPVGQIVNPISATTTFTAAYNTDINNAINGSGLITFPSLSSKHGKTSPDESFVANEITGSVDFNLGGTFKINGIAFWNQNGDGPGELGTSGINDVSFYASTDGVSYSVILGAPTRFLKIPSTLATPETFSFVGVDATHIRMTVTSNHGYPQTGFGEIAFAAEETLSVDQFAIKKSVQLFPNPSSDFIQVSGLTETKKYRLYNVLGTEMKKGTVQKNQKINIQYLTNGFYFLEFNDGNTIKFLKK